MGHRDFRDKVQIASRRVAMLRNKKSKYGVLMFMFPNSPHYNKWKKKLDYSNKNL